MLKFCKIRGLLAIKFFKLYMYICVCGFLLFCYAQGANAKQKYALVIGGASQHAEPHRHEFARITAAVSKGLVDKDYKVTTFFGGNQSSPSSHAKKEYEKYPEDYRYIQTLQKLDESSVQNSHATPENITNYFENLIEKIKPGDQIEIHVAAHGNDSCGSFGPYKKSDVGSSCKHTFAIFDSKGKVIEILSEELVGYIKKLEDKGALPTLVLNSCHSGRTKQAFQALNLKNTCIYFLTAGNEVGYGCFESDPDFSKDFTSSGEYVALRYYKEIMDKLEDDPYFSESSCFQKIKQRAEEKKIDFSTVETTYWSSRSQDETFQSPALSTLLDSSYFTTGVLQPQMTQQKTLSCEPIDHPNSPLFQQFSQLQSQISDVVKAPYNEALKKYNNSVVKLKKELQKTSPQTPLRRRVIAKLQGDVKRSAENFIKQERVLIHSLFKKESLSSDPCSRSL